MFRRPFSRGTSVLAALVFVAILGTVAYGVSAVTPGANPSAQLGQAVNATLASPAELAAQKALIDGSAAGKEQDCTPGYDYTVKENSGVPQIEPQSVCPIGQNAAQSASKSGTKVGTVATAIPGQGTWGLKNDPARCEKDPKNPLQYKPKSGYLCLTKYCVTAPGGKQHCSLATGLSAPGFGINPNSIRGQFRPSTVADLMKSISPADQKEALATAGVSPDEQKALQGAFTEKAAETAQQVKQNTDSMNSLQSLIDNCGNGASINEFGMTMTGNCDNVSDLEKQKTQLAEQNAALKKQMTNLAAAQKADLSSLPPVNPSTLSKEAFTKAFCDSNPQDPSCPGGPKETFTKNPGSPRDPGAGRGDPEPPSSGGLGGLGNALQSILGGLAKALGGAGSGSGGGPACASDPNAYAQQQQQYNAALQQYNLQLQQYNYQQQMNRLNGLPAPTPPQPPSQCTQTPSSNTCAAAPAKPAASGCANGSWKPVTTQQSNGASCTTSWQCVPGGSGVTPTAEISCQPKVADVGMSVAITYGCTNATESLGAGFDTGGATSGSTTTVIATPPDGANAINYGIQCRNQGLIGQAQCSVQIGKPSIVLLANPKIVPVNTASSVGWVTASMASCVVSSPDLPDFTAQNAGNTSVNGMATTSPLTQDTLILLHCITVGGNTKDATTTIQIATSTTP